MKDLIEPINSGTQQARQTGLGELHGTLTNFLTPGVFMGGLQSDIERISEMSAGEIVMTNFKLVSMGSAIDLTKKVETSFVQGVHKLTFSN